MSFCYITLYNRYICYITRYLCYITLRYITWHISRYYIKMYENNKGHSVRGAIIACSNDVPAARKLCGSISACVACYRCHKMANFVNNQSNFGGFADLDEWFIERDI